MPLRKAAILGVLLGFGYSCLIFAAPTVINLQQALNFARYNHPKIKMQQQEYKQQQANIIKARSAVLPHLQLSAAYSNGMSGASSGLGISALSNSAFRDGYGVSLDLEQNIYDFGRTSAKIGAARAKLEETHWQEKITLADILKNAADSYYECQRAKHYVNVYKKAYRNIKPLVQEVRRFVNTGQRSAVDLYLANIYTKEISDSLISANKYEQAAIINLNLAISAQSSYQFTCGENGWPRSLSVPHQDSYYLSIAKTHRPEFHLLKAAQTYIQSEKKAAKAEFFPRITGIVSVGKIQDVNVNEIHAKNYVVAIGVAIPLFDGLATYAKLNKTIAKSKALYYKQELTNQQINSQVAQALLEYERTKLLFHKAKQRRQEANQALQLAERRYLSKSGLLVEWEEAYRVWLSSQISYWDLGFAQKKAITQLKYSAGTLDNFR